MWYTSLILVFRRLEARGSQVPGTQSKIFVPPLAKNKQAKAPISKPISKNHLCYLSIHPSIYHPSIYPSIYDRVSSIPGCPPTLYVMWTSMPLPQLSLQTSFWVFSFQTSTTIPVAVRTKPRFREVEARALPTEPHPSPGLVCFVLLCFLSRSYQTPHSGFLQTCRHKWPSHLRLPSSWDCMCEPLGSACLLFNYVQIYKCTVTETIHCSGSQHPWFYDP